MATIGSAVLQIIPSLRGVSEAIEKEVGGKVVNVTVAPKADRQATERVAKQTRETVEKQTKQVKVEPKVNQDAAKKAGKQAGKTVSDEMASTVKSSSAAKDAAKVFVDGVADGVKREMPRGGVAEVFVDGLADGIKQGIDGVGLGGQVVTTISTGINSGNLAGTIRDAVVPAVKGIGNEIRSSASDWASNIGDSLRSGDIQGATKEIGDTVRNTTDLISEIGSTFGLQLDGVREFGDGAATALDDVGTEIQGVITTATGIKTTFDSVGNLLENVLPGKAGTGAKRIADALGSIAVPAWLLYLVAEDRSGRKWGNGDPVSALPTPDDFTPGKRSTNEILYGPYLGPLLDKTLGINPPEPPKPQSRGAGGGTMRPSVSMRPGFGSGGSVFGAGSATSDSIPALLSNGEHVLTAKDVQAMGGQSAVYAFRDMLHRAGGGPVSGSEDSTSLLPTHRALIQAQKDTATGIFRDGAQKWGWWWNEGDPNAPGQFNEGIKLDLSRVSVAGYKGGGKVQLGNISGPGITTAEQQSMWDAVRGKFPGAILSSATRAVMTEGHPDFHNAGRAIDISGPGMGAIASWIASTYPDSLELIHSPFGHNIKNGKDVGDGMAFYGAKLMAAHRNHVHWALGKSAAIAAATDMLPALGLDASSPMTAPSVESTANSGAAQSSGISLAGSFSGLAGMYGDQIGQLSPVTSPDGKTQSLNKIGDAAGQFASGQVSSLLGTFGINDSPGWLKGLSMIASGIKVGGPIGAAGAAAGGGDSGGPAPMVPSIAPLANAAASTVGGFLGAGGQQPAQQTVYNIQTTDIEPAYLASQRQEKENAAAKLARF